MTSLTNQRGAVMYVCRNSMHNFMALRFEGAAVIVTSDLIHREYQADDIVEFDASGISKADANLYNTVKPKWKASRCKFVKHAQTFTGTGKILNIDPKGEYCFVEAQQSGVTYNVFCTRISVQPALNSLHSMFQTGSSIKFFAKEQVATQKNNNVKWRTVVATDMKHELRPKQNGAIFTYEACVAAPPPPKVVPKLRMPAPSGAPRPANAAEAVKQNTAPASPVPAVAPAAVPSPVAPPPRRAPTPILATIEKTKPPSPPVSPIEQPVKKEIPKAVGTKPYSPAQSPVESQLSNGISHESLDEIDGISLAPPPGLNGTTPNLSSHPMPSYEWMKFDLISTLQSFHAKAMKNHHLGPQATAFLTTSGHF